MKIHGIEFEKQSMKAQGIEFEKQSIRELNLQVQEGTQRGLSHEDEAKGSASKLPRTGDTQGVSVCFLSFSNPEGYYISVEEARGWISQEERRRTRTGASSATPESKDDKHVMNKKWTGESPDKNGSSEMSRGLSST